MRLSLYKVNIDQMCPMCKKGKIIKKTAKLSKIKYLGCDSEKCKFSQSI